MDKYIVYAEKYDNKMWIKDAFLYDIEKYADQSKGEDFLLCIEISYSEGFIFKRKYKVIYPGRGIDLNSYVKTLKERLKYYSFEIVDVTKKFIIIKFSNVLKSNIKLLADVKNNYLDFNDKNRSIIFELKHETERILRNYKIDRDALYCKIFIDKHRISINDCGSIDYSKFGMSAITNTYDVFLLGYSVYANCCFCCNYDSKWKHKNYECGEFKLNPAGERCFFTISRIRPELKSWN